MKQFAAMPCLLGLLLAGAGCGTDLDPVEADPADGTPANESAGLSTESGSESAPKPDAAAALELEGPVTWSRDVAPILYDNCVTCHRPSGGAPFDLLTFEDARRRAKQVVIVTESRYMPPWLPAEGDYPLMGERTLDDRQLAVLRRWADEGMPEGDPADRPEPPVFAEGWHLGEPDLIVRMPASYTVPAEGTDIFRNFVLPVVIDAPAYVQAAEIRPDNRAVVHHASMVVDRSGSSRQRDAEDPELGFGGIETFVESDEPHGFFLNFKPGTVPNPGRPDMSWRVDRQTDLVLNMHLQPTGRPEELLVEVGLYFAEAPPTLHPYILRLNCDDDIDIPAGEPAFVVTDELVLPVDVKLFGVYPHMHYLGRIVEGYATLPDGTRKTLIHIPDWDFNWQAVYTYEEPIDLPAGTLLSMRFTLDNSAANPRNPSNPPRRVESGNRSEDEMAHLGLQLVPETREGTFELQAALMRARITKDPSNSTAYSRLGDALRSLGRNDPAMQQYRRAIALNPSDLLAQNNLAGLLLASGRPERAEELLRAIVSQNPSYLHGLENLAFVLLSRGEFVEAQDYLERIVGLDPQNAEALNRLGRVHLQSRQLEEARSCFEAAARAEPTNAEAHFNLGGLLAALGQLEPAIEKFELVLELEPGHAGARETLAKARARLQ